MQSFIKMFAVSGLLLLASAWACDPNTISSKAKHWQENGQSFKALAYLEDTYKQCSHPRLLLEQGALWQSLGRPEQAIQVWQQALADPTLPDPVRKKVSLKILQAQLSPYEAATLQIRLNLDSRFQNTFSSSLGANATTTIAPPPVALIGRPLQPMVYGQIGGQYRRFWQDPPDNTQSLLSLATGGSLTWHHWRLTSQWRLTSLEGIEQQSVTIGGRWQASALKIGTLAAWSVNDQSWSIEPQLGWHTSQWRIDLSSQVGEFDQPQWQSDTQFKARWQTRFQPTLTVNYDTSANAPWRLGTRARWPLNEHWQLRGKAESDLAEQPEWLVQIGLNGRFKL